MSDNLQRAPYPEDLAYLVSCLRYKPHWTFELNHLDRGQGSLGLTLIISTTTANSYQHDNLIRVAHYFPVPPAAYDMRSWQHWLLERLLLVERHEACEFFTVQHADGQLVKPYAPSHGPGNDPYLIREIGTDLDVRTAYTGEIDR